MPKASNGATYIRDAPKHRILATAKEFFLPRQDIDPLREESGALTEGFSPPPKENLLLKEAHEIQRKGKYPPEERRTPPEEGPVLPGEHFSPSREHSEPPREGGLPPREGGLPPCEDVCLDGQDAFLRWREKYVVMAGLMARRRTKAAKYSFPEVRVQLTLERTT